MFFIFFFLSGNPILYGVPTQNFFEKKCKGTFFKKFLVFKPMVFAIHSIFSGLFFDFFEFSFSVQAEEENSKKSKKKKKIAKIKPRRRYFFEDLSKIFHGITQSPINGRLRDAVEDFFPKSMISRKKRDKYKNKNKQAAIYSASQYPLFFAKNRKKFSFYYIFLPITILL